MALVALLLPALSVALDDVEVSTEEQKAVSAPPNGHDGADAAAPRTRLRAAVRTLHVSVRSVQAGGVRCTIDVCGAEAEVPAGHVVLSTCRVQAVRTHPVSDTLVCVCSSYANQ